MIEKSGGGCGAGCGAGCARGWIDVIRAVAKPKARSQERTKVRCCCRCCISIATAVIAAHKGRCFAERLRRVLVPGFTRAIDAHPGRNGTKLKLDHATRNIKIEDVSSVRRRCCLRRRCSRLSRYYTEYNGFFNDFSNDHAQSAKPSTTTADRSSLVVSPISLSATCRLHRAQKFPGFGRFTVLYLK